MYVVVECVIFPIFIFLFWDIFIHVLLYNFHDDLILYNVSVCVAELYKCSPNCTIEQRGIHRKYNSMCCWDQMGEKMETSGSDKNIVMHITNGRNECYLC